MSKQKFSPFLIEVKQLLINKPETRDSDIELYNCILINRGILPQSVTMANRGNLPKEATIERARRKIQQHFPETRGTLWYKRHRQAEIDSEEIVDLSKAFTGSDFDIDSNLK